MNIDQFCDKPCCSGGAVSTATPEGIQRVREALDRLGNPDSVDYTDVVDAFTLKNESGEPCHTIGYEGYLNLGTDITCDCVLRFVLRKCGYTDIGEPGKYVLVEEVA
jgi:hypothetical protein